MRRLLKKVLRDLFMDKRRAVLSLLAILIGTMSFGMMTFSYHMISREIVSVYDAIHSASGTIMLDRVDDELMALSDAFPGIAAIEAKSHHQLRVQVGENRWKTLELFAAEDFSALISSIN